ncbi:alpha/beta hydrolase [Mycobacterium sp. B14F4]|uniref:esterase/lipase family protein n=1 Tax=Mycobacterium sp. B14F4 TaxID=3153565 RepID=UPI00325F5EE4
MITAPHRGHAAPGYLLYLTDPARAVYDYSLLTYSMPLLAALPRGDGHPVLVLPRLHGTDISTIPLRTILKGLGYRTYGWQLGFNIGPTSKVVHGIRARLDYLTNHHQCPVTIIGWSLGGIYARQLARRNPQAVRQVITLGSPIRLARHEQSRANRLFHLYAHEHIEPLNLPLERGEGPLPVPATSIYTPLDGIVAWRTCLDEPSPQSENIAVLASHLGIAYHPAALWVIADRLAQPADEWKPFQPPPLLRAAYLISGS